MSKDGIDILRVGLAHLAHALQELGGQPPLAIEVDFDTLFAIRGLVGSNRYFRFDHSRQEGVLEIDGVRFEARDQRKRQAS